MDQLCSQPEAEQPSEVSLAATHCIAGQGSKYIRAHSNGAIFSASLENASRLGLGLGLGLECFEVGQAMGFDS